MNRGDIYRVSLDPTEGREQQGFRPVLVVSPLTFNEATKLPVILPITNGGAFVRRIGFAGCFYFMKSLIEEKDQPWTFLLPGSVAVFVGFVALVFGLFATSSNGQGNAGAIALFVAIFLISVVYALYHNTKGVGVYDGICVTVVQSCLALFVVASAVAFMYFMPSGGGRRHRH